MPDGKPSVQQIADASQNGCGVKYVTVTYQGIEILMLKRLVENAVKITVEFTHSPEVEKLAQEMGIKLRRFK